MDIVVGSVFTIFPLTVISLPICSLPVSEVFYQAIHLVLVLLSVHKIGLSVTGIPYIKNLESISREPRLKQLSTSFLLKLKLCSLAEKTGVL
ncbi:hypothetical protein [Methanonatronarchaeum sp. AMET-Sl]|uniref:hypothetical protein n=1 Tax=Methanonatronarchaeum sp. AMET-Sl TaxID=3037654 RepID=UPI00244DC48A|nr:hypothetical protein [Methanonatronarchaeum sp. AMET-Sl]WGI17684.1 hypothetical protein QEN48_01360 [Methanonatronarchaeum sp. AMET-Sl]